MQFQQLDFNSPKVLTIQLADVIERKIRNKELSVGQKLPTQAELKKIFGVSIETVNEALWKLVQEGYISSRPRHGTFVISTSPKTGVDLTVKNEVCLVVGATYFLNESTSPKFTGLMSAIEGEARKKNMHLLFKLIGGANTELGLENKEKSVAGLILAGNVTRENISMVKKTGFPFIIIGDVLDKIITKDDFDVVATDDYSGVYAGVKRLVGSGSKRILFIRVALADYPWETDQLNGYKQALQDSGIAFDKNLVLDTHETPESGYEAARAFLEKQIPFDSILFIGFGRAKFGQISKAFAEKNIKMPGTLLQVVSGNIPGIPAMARDDEETGRTAFSRLCQRLTDPGWKPERIIAPLKTFTPEAK
ncbi:MAG: hypothetical protein A2297_09310 [Elusimicrobia bacterium RIFOXYB2_FULL_48_7]|nr:MAG: hypothetical protein A2297_09310 [Elusimicrobia bacterium RIFOXYB2_FULL_48_7]